jgi:hypothetical protein
LAGGIGGTAYWCFNYPIDYVKTLIQSDSFENPKYKGKNLSNFRIFGLYQTAVCAQRSQGFL